MKLYLADSDRELVESWQHCFAEYLDVNIERAEVLSVAKGCVVLPVDDRGVLLPETLSRWVDYFGSRIEPMIREVVSGRAGANLAVGAGVVIATGDVRIPHIIVVSVIDLRHRFRSENVYHAMRAVLRLAERKPELAEALYCAGLGAEVGKVPLKSVAEQMARAYASWRDGVPRTGAVYQMRM